MWCWRSMWRRRRSRGTSGSATVLIMLLRAGSHRDSCSEYCRQYKRPGSLCHFYPPPAELCSVVQLIQREEVQKSGG